MKKLVIASIAAISAPALAQDSSTPELSYTYAELRYLDTDGGGDGLRVSGSYALDENWLIVGGLTSVDYGSSVDTTTIEIGAGYRFELENDFDFIATLQFIDTDVDTPFGGADDSGFKLSGGARGMLTDELEVRGSVNHVNLDNNDTYLELAGDYHFSESLSAGASLEFAGDSDLFSIGVRYYFR